MRGDLRTFGSGTWQGGGVPERVTEFLHYLDTAGPPLRGGDVGPYEEDGVALDAFQGRFAKKLTERQPRRGRDGRWFYPSLAGAMKKAGIVGIRTSILRRQNTVAQFIVTWPILGLCERAVRRPGARVPRR